MRNLLWLAIVASAGLSVPAATRDAVDSYECTLARQGYFVAEEGATAEAVCPVGSYSPGPGLPGCTPANSGSFVGVEGALASRFLSSPTPTTLPDHGLDHDHDLYLYLSSPSSLHLHLLLFPTMDSTTTTTYTYQVPARDAARAQKGAPDLPSLWSSNLTLIEHTMS